MISPEDILKDDRRLLAAVASALDEASRRSGAWLVCRPGCTSCCLGPFPITGLDALRLRQGLSVLAAFDPARAGRIRDRAAVTPADVDDVPCPALDPETGCCELYEWRPMTCRTFGPAMWTEDGGVGACELCYAGATGNQVIHCAVEIDPEGLERELLDALEGAGITGTTSVSEALSMG